MRFNKFGQTYQLNIQTSDDLLDVLELDESLWVASSAPLSSFRTDVRFLKHVDFDQNGRINTIEIKESIRWMQSVFKHLDQVAWGQDLLKLDSISQDSEAGKQILSSAAYLLGTLEADSTQHISLTQVRLFLSNIRKQPLNGDGTVIPDAATDDGTREFIQDIIRCRGSHEDVSGKAGVTSASLKEFVAAIESFLTWRNQGEGSARDEADSFLPLGTDTAAAYQLLSRHRDKIDHYFKVGRAVHFKPELHTSLESKTALTQGP